MTAPDAAPRTARGRTQRGETMAGLATKLVLLAIVNAFGVHLIWQALTQESYGVAIGGIVLLAAVDLVYLLRRTLPLKYLAPGLAFLAVMQLFTMVYTGYVAFTNYGTGHNGNQQQAVDALLIQNERRLEDSPTYPVTIVRDDAGRVGLAVVTGEGVARAGTAAEPLADVPDATVEDDRVSALPGWTVVQRGELLGDRALQEEVTTLRVPVSEDPEDGSIRTRDGLSAAVNISSMEWDEQAQTLTDTAAGVVYRATDDGTFRADDGTALPVGWRVNVGVDNFVRAFTDTDYSSPFVRILVWTFAFAIGSVVTGFLLGLLLASIFDDSRFRGRKVWRTLFILPYAFPAFLSALLWRGMLNANPDYGIINQVVFFGTRIPWLDDPVLAKITLLGVNLWLSFPYWFLVCTGALQSLPADVTEAARIDGAGPTRIWRSISLPLLLVSTAPLLIASFAFNFNNFTLIYMLTGGGPRFSDTSALLGHTDILISMVYQISGVAGGRADFGLASALSIVVFAVVGVISLVAFRRTRSLEEVL